MVHALCSSDRGACSSHRHIGLAYLALAPDGNVYALKPHTSVVYALKRHLSWQPSHTLVSVGKLLALWYQLAAL